MAQRYIPSDGIHRTKLNRPGGCPSDVMIWRNFGFHDEVDAWARGADSEANREFRIRCLEAAFALPVNYVTKRGSFGDGIMHRMREWMAEHPDLELNRPEFEKTFFCDLDDLG